MSDANGLNELASRIAAQGSEGVQHEPGTCAICDVNYVNMNHAPVTNTATVKPCTTIQLSESVLPSASRHTTAYFLVEITGTDVPPDWKSKVFERLKKELHHRFGPSAQASEARPIDEA